MATCSFVALQQALQEVEVHPLLVGVVPLLVARGGHHEKAVAQQVVEDPQREKKGHTATAGLAPEAQWIGLAPCRSEGQEVRNRKFVDDRAAVVVVPRTARLHHMQQGRIGKPCVNATIS